MNGTGVAFLSYAILAKGRIPRNALLSDSGEHLHLERARFFWGGLLLGRAGPWTPPGQPSSVPPC